MDLEILLIDLETDTAAFRDDNRHPSMVLLAHQPPTIDPLFGLYYTLVRLGTHGRVAIDALKTASAVSDVESRRDAALLSVAGLEASHLLVPLLRLHAWLEIDDLHDGFEPGPAGVLRIRQ